MYNCNKHNQSHSIGNYCDICYFIVLCYNVNLVHYNNRQLFQGFSRSHIAHCNHSLVKYWNCRVSHANLLPLVFDHMRLEVPIL